MGVDRPTLFWPVTGIVLVSAASMALEIVAGRALAPYVGMSLYTWTIVIAVVLAGLSLGHWLGGVIADRTAAPGRAVGLALGGAALSAVVCLGALRLAAGLADGAGPLALTGTLAMAAFFLPSALAGLVSPLLTVIALGSVAPGRRGRVLGLVFAAGALGAILGTLVAGLVLISWLGSTGAVIVVAAVYAALALRFLGGVGRGFGAGLMVLTGAAVLGMPERLGLAPACRDESAYFCIRVDPVPAAGREARVLALDHLAHGVNDRADPRLLLSPYVHGVDELVAARPGTVDAAFFVGGGAYTLPRAWQARYPRAQLVVAELDPAVTRVAGEALWFTLGPGTAIHHGDARRILTDLPPEMRFDVIFGDAFHDISIPAHLVTAEFARLVAERLGPDGLYALNVVDGRRAPRFVLSLARTLRTVFTHVELWLDLDSIGPGDARTTWIVLAGATPTGTDRVRARYGPARIWVRVPLDAMIAATGADRLEHLTDDYAPVARLLAPVLMDADRAEHASGN